MSKSDLRIDWATHAAAKFACDNWHYARRVPVNKLLKLGVWESGSFIGVVLFGVGSSAQLHRPFDIQRHEVCELVRIALAKHKTQVSRIIAVSLKFLKKSNPLIRVCVSFADSTRGHHGGVYQATNWIYTGTSAKTTEYFIDGRWYQMTSNNLAKIKLSQKDRKTRSVPGKHRYLMPLDDEMRKQIEPLRKPYPKRVRSVDSDTSTVQVEMGGATPTRTL